MKPAFIKAHLAEAGWSLAEIADELGVSPSAVSRVISGERQSRRIAKAVARAIGKPVSEIWTDKYISAKCRRRTAA